MKDVKNKNILTVYIEWVITAKSRLRYMVTYNQYYKNPKCFNQLEHCHFFVSFLNKNFQIFVYVKHI